MPSNTRIRTQARVPRKDHNFFPCAVTDGFRLPAAKVRKRAAGKNGDVASDSKPFLHVTWDAAVVTVGDIVIGRYIVGQIVCIVTIGGAQPPRPRPR